MIETVQFVPEHILRIDLQAAQFDTLSVIHEKYGKALAEAGPAVTLIDGDEVLACGGMVKEWESRHAFWVMMSKNAKNHMIRITRIAKRFMRLHALSGRFEATVRSDFEEGHRWAQMMGLRYDHHEEKGLPGGIDADVYVMVI